MRRRFVRWATVLAVAAAGTAVAGSPALAANVGCSIPAASYSCTTSVLAPSSGHQIKIKARGGSNSDTTCYLDDTASGAPVNSVYASWLGFSEKTVGGLHSTYYLTCFGGLDDWAPGGGSMFTG